MSLATGTRIGSYEIVGPVGAGGMGEVYLARDARLNRDVALKILGDRYRFDAHRLARFEREAQVLASLNHPNIATLLGIESGDDVQALIMEFVDGETLEARLSFGSLPLATALLIAGQIVDALDAAHERGVIHRDLKPANVMLRPDGKVKVLDFGLAKTLETEAESAGASLTTLTATAHAILGTAAYMSPEQARGGAVDRRTDVWGFGCVLYEMLTGRRAFDGVTNSDAMAAVLTQEPDWTPLPAHVPEPVRRLLRRCLEKDARHRIRDIADAREDLQAPHYSSAHLAAPATKTERPSRRTTIALAAGALLILLAAIGAFWNPWSSSTARPEQFVLLPPDGTSFGGGVIDRTPALAISPDGERLAFVATDRRTGSRPMLWVRAVRSLDAIPFSGTEGAREPFWSPDGRFIAFFADGKLKKIPSTGGTPTTLADASLGSGGTWNRDNVIIFAPNTQSSLQRIPHTGGTPTPITRLSEGEYGHVYPQFLPDGRRFIYLARAVPARKGIYIASIDSPNVTFIMNAREKARHAASGHLMFLEEGRLMAQSFDPETLRLGSAVAVVESVAFISTDGRASFDVSDTGVLVYRANGLLAASQPVWVDATGKTVATVGEPGDYQTASVSPDGSMMVVEKHDLRTSSGDLWLIDLKAGATSRLTFDGMHNTRAVWAPDGKRIVFTGRPNGIRNLHLKSIGTESEESLLRPGPDRLPTDWSSDGSRILYEEGFATARDLLVMEMPERRSVPFLNSPFDERSAKFSPDGRWVAYLSDESGRHEVYVRSYLAGGDKRQVSINGGHAPRWSRDGRTLFYADPNGSVMAIDIVISGPALRAGSPRALFAADMRRAESGTGITADTWFAVNGEQFFIVPGPTGPMPPAPPITVTTNWLPRAQ